MTITQLAVLSIPVMLAVDFMIVFLCVYEVISGRKRRIR